MDAVLIVTPYYNKPTQEGLYRHYVAVADASSVPVILYNVPSRTVCDLLPETVARLAAHPRIADIKEATADLTRVKPLLAIRPGFVVLSGDDATAREFIQLGGQVVISVTASVWPRLMQGSTRPRSPGDKRVTPSPTASTSTPSSWPGMRGYRKNGNLPSQPLRSVPQTPIRCVRTST